jgi:hypothetical protein
MIVVHYCVREEKVEFLKAIVESYLILVPNPAKFFEWFTLENNQNMNAFDIAAQRPNKDIIKFLYDIIKKTDESKLRLTERRNNLFHNAAKRNECYPIVIIYNLQYKLDIFL